MKTDSSDLDRPLYLVRYSEIEAEYMIQSFPLFVIW